MTDVIFARSEHFYGSYVDFWRLVEVSGYQTCWIKDIDPQSDNTYLVTPLNGEWNSGFKNPKARIIHIDLEWRDVENYPVIPGVSETWVSDAYYSQMTGARYVPLGSDARLPVSPPSDDEPIYDVALMMYRDPYRRAHLISRLQELHISIAPNHPAGLHYGDTHNFAKRDALLRQSRCMLHIHQHEGIRTVAPLRFAVAAAYGLPLVSETVEDQGIFSPGYVKGFPVSFHEYDQLPSMVGITGLFKNTAGKELHHLLCQELTFRKSVEAAL